MAQSPLNDTTHSVDSEEEGRSPTTDRWWLIKKEKVLFKLSIVVWYVVDLSEPQEWMAMMDFQESQEEMAWTVMTAYQDQRVGQKLFF